MNERNQSAWCFSHNVRYLREKKGLTQEELAADSGVSVNEISKVERRLVIPRLNMVDHIANAFRLFQATPMKLTSLLYQCSRSGHYEGLSSRYNLAGLNQKVQTQWTTRRS